jgi:LmbE family N-acetylglucosaminyl deacetylase
VKELVVAPHPDDEAIGCGGIVAQNAAEGSRISVAFLSSGECGIPSKAAPDAVREREREAVAAAEILGVAELHFLRAPDGQIEAQCEKTARTLADVLRDDPPDLIRIPHPLDGHADHHAAWPVVQNALRIAGIPTPQILAYEVWTPMTTPDYTEDISSVMERKLAAIRCYASQLQQLPYDRGIAGLNAYRGAFLGGSLYAEAVRHLYLPEADSTSGR